jgi:F-type H+-transporting ATPase subunit gamma
MKMVSAAKLKGDENRLKVAKSFNMWSENMCGPPMDMEGATFEDLPQKTLIVPFTSDKGLCGGVNSYITRGVRRVVISLDKQGKESDVVVVGDKGRQQLNRFVNESIIRSATDVVSPGTFALASALSTEIIAAGGLEYDAIMLVYNSFVNPAVYEQKYKIIKPFHVSGEGEESLHSFEFDSDKPESVEDMYEFLIASQVFHSFLDGAASEQSSRMTAMENATKNAGEMIDALTLKYNRARQSRITTELIEIISGASALDDPK